MFKTVRGVLAILLITGTATTAMAQAPKSRPNSIKYKDAGAKPATGRSGSASLEVRALMSSDGTMQVEASTGSLEGGTHPGSIAKVQVKASAFTQNFNNLTGNGYWTATFPSVARSTNIQVQAGIRGIDPNRTDVVTVSVPALLRPDIFVSAVAGPSQSMPNSPVHFTATLSETNGDLGARANCVLSINGTTVMTNEGIWIDAGDTVSCAFDYTFTAAGNYTVRVSATNVAPADWNLANNQAETSIAILAPNQRIQSGQMVAEQMNYLQRHTDNNSFDVTTKYDLSTATLLGWTQADAARVARVDATLFRNGVIAHSVSLTPSGTWDYNDGSYFQKCGSYDAVTHTQTPNGTQSASSGDAMTMCSYGAVNDPSNQWSFFYYSRIAGTVVYEHTINGWYYNSSMSYGNGFDMGWTIGDAIRVKVEFIDAIGARFNADQTAVLGDQSNRYNYSEWYSTGYLTVSGRYYYGIVRWQQQ